MMNSLTRFIEDLNQDINGFFDTNLNDVSFGFIIVVAAIILIAVVKSVFMNKQ